MLRRVEAAAPTRIDFAGGTVDLWPLYLLHDEPLTVNAAIDLYARATVEDASGGVEVISRDRGARLGPIPVERLTQTVRTAPPELEFLLRLAAHFLASSGRSCRITTECAAPAGSGLGGSSTLGIALATALDRYVGRRLDPDRLLALTRAIETQVLRIPTGEQDYHPALRGGVLALHYTVEGTRPETVLVERYTVMASCRSQAAIWATPCVCTWNGSRAAPVSKALNMSRTEPPKLNERSSVCRSAVPIRPILTSRRVSCSTFRCVSSTPFGCPVEPEV